MKITDAISSIGSPALQSACKEIFNYPEFQTWPASLGYHHAFKGGLLAHTEEVLWHAQYTADAKLKKDINKDVLFAAALWHDLGKIWDYSYESGCIPPEWSGKRSLADQEGMFIKGHWVLSDFQNKIHHINGSCAEFTAAALKHGVDRGTIQKVQHAILAHHGPNRDWGSPVKPQSVEAHILHMADNLSASYGATA